MTNQEMLDKLIKGTEKTETIQITYEGIETEWTIKPLTSGELTRLQTLEKKGFNMKISMQNGKRQAVQTNMNDVDINVGEFNEYQTEAMYTAISISTGLDVEAIKELPASVPEQLFEQVIRISNLSDNDLTIIKNFRKDK